MKAMCIDENRNFVWQDVPEPVCHGEFDVKLKVEACAVNRADLMQRAGIYAPPEGWPLWPGLECAGVVLEAPAGGRFRPGDRVCALLGGGGYAERVVVPEGMCMPLPRGFEPWEAAGLPEVYATAYLNLKIVGEIKRGETFFINGGEGGLGVACIQLAKHVFGAKVVAQVASDENGEFCKSVGADVVCNRFKDDLVATLRANPPDVAIDPVGGKLMGPCLATRSSASCTRATARRSRSVAARFPTTCTTCRRFGRSSPRASAAFAPRWPPRSRSVRRAIRTGGSSLRRPLRDSTPSMRSS